MSQGIAMNDELESLKKLLIEGQRKSKQGSYMRRAPARPALPFLLQARAGLKKFVEANANDAQAWRLLSQGEECLLNYVAAVRCLEKAMSFSTLKDRKDLKRLAQLREHERQWAELTLKPAELAELGRHLKNRLSEEPCDHTLRLTKVWLNAGHFDKPGSVLEAMRNRGGFCDCEVLSNVVAS